MALIRVRVQGLMMDERSKSPIVLLREEDGEATLPIWIGESEARAVGIVLAGEKLDRPLTHDLMLLMVQTLGAKVVSVAITELRENTFFAEIQLERDGRKILVDARPSDSIALALRADAAIYVAEEVMERGTAAAPSKPPERTQKEIEADLKKFLENLDPGDFGRFGV